MSTDQPPPHYRDGGDAAILVQGQWRLLRNLAGADADDWVCWHVSVPDTGQGGEAALAELLAAAQEAGS